MKRGRLLPGLVGLAWVLLSGGAVAAGLDAVTDRLAQDAIATGEFTQQRQVASLPFPLRSTGEFVLQRGQGLYWHVLTPAESELRILGGQVEERVGGEAAAWTALPMGEQSNRMTARLLTDLLSGEFASLDSVFAHVVDANDAGWTVQLTPRSGAAMEFVEAITVLGDRHVEKIILLHGGGETTTIRLDTASPRALTSRERDILSD